MMARTKMTGLVLALTLGVSTVSLAQAPAKGEHAGHGEHGDSAKVRGRGPAGPLGFLLKDIELTADQKAKLQALAPQYGMKRDSANRGERPSREERIALREQMQGRREQMLADFRAILTPDQLTVFERNLAEAKGRAGEGREGRRGKGKGRSESRS
jgi:Spy/CpxP family protein refolding chaperone